MASAQAALEETTEAILRGLGEAAAGFAGRSLLLTGAGGLLGRWIVKTIAALNQRQAPCYVLSVDAGDLAGPVREELLALGDYIYNREGVISLPQRSFDYAMHAAGVASPYWYERFPLETISAAVDGSRSILAQLLKQSPTTRYLFFGSSEIYQTPPPEAVPTPETYVGAVPTMGRRSCYDVSKALGETLAHVYHARYGLNTGVVRIFNGFGPLLRENDHRILARLASAWVSGRTLQIFVEGWPPPSGSTVHFPTRTYCPVANTVAGCLLALVRGKPGEVYNIGADSPEIDVIQLAQRCAQLITELPALPDRPSIPQQTKPIHYALVPAPAVYTQEPQRRCPDISKARRELGYEPQVSLDDGLRVFLDWARENYDGLTAA